MISPGDRKPVSILFVLPNFRMGGAERVILTLLSLLDRHRFAPELVVFDGKGEFADLLPKDIMLHDLGATRLRSALWPLLCVIRKRRPDLIFSSHSYVNLALLASRVALPKLTRVVVREPSTPSKSLPDTNYGRFLSLGYHALFRRADTVICLNREVERDLSSGYGVDLSRLVLLPNPVAVASLRQSAANLSHDESPGRRLVAAGRLSHAKGFDTLLGALSATSEDVFLTIYGDGPEESALRSLCRKLGLDKRVRFAGFEKHLAPALAGADAVIVPSRWEGFPNIVLESLACGTPVISTRDAGGVIELSNEISSDALTLVSSEQELAEEIDKVKESKSRELRPNLLPPRFEDKNVAKLFADTLEKAVFGADS
ncbi:glycosyltransferase [Pelagibius sp. Alg239-R121]|uniref:glycosyltransferase n=1 Tax=Pelagibius sp. Alg239-R121 TaxID=2993448 RepID=UPI0024A7828D|nr:glycosyltransferase [Pelagibius sp. Alg239-R121]